MAKFIGFVVIFAATGSSALALIAGALLVIRGRRSR
jgi:hypothetical protein